MRRHFRAIVLGFVIAGLAGCGGDSSGGGAPPTKASQLEGRWVRRGEAEFDTMEFLEDGKGIVGGESGGLSVAYSLLEGGRLSLTGASGGLATIYDVKLAGDELELSSKGSMLSGAGTYRYRRLKKGESVSQALAEQAKARAEAFRKRVADVRTYLEQPGLVLTWAEGAGAPASIALDIQTEGSSFAGRAWFDDRPPHLNAISGSVTQNESAQSVQLAVNYGARIAPRSAQQDGAGNFSLNVEGDGKNLRISAKLRVGGGAEHEMVLRADPKLHADIVKRYEAELARIEDMKKPIAGVLQDYAVLHGTLAPMDQRKATPDTVDLELVRDAKSGQYWVEGTYVGARDRGELLTKAAAEILVVNNRAVLRVVCPPQREFQLQLPDPKGGRLAGLWMPLNTNQGQSAQFEVVEALDAAARDARFAARRKAITSLRADSALAGLAFEDSATGMEMPIPFRLQLTVKPDGSAAGKAEYPSVSTVMTVAGAIADTPVGPRLQLNFTAAESTPGDKIFFRSIQGGTWSFVPAEGAGPTKLTGYFTGPPLRPTALTLASDESTAALRKKLADTLGRDGRVYVSKFVGWQQPGIPPTVLELKLDGAANSIRGTALADGRALGGNEKVVATQEGQVRAENGFLVIEMMQTFLWGNNRAVTAIKLYVCEDAAGRLHLNGAMRGLPNIGKDQPMPEFPAQLDRLVELIPVADADATTHAAIDQAIAAVAKAQADAKAAGDAAATAALDAKRAKLAPFFPMFEGKSGLVILTDAPAPLGTLLLDAQVDEAKATITGKGIDLREMPLREFTYECGVDGYGNLTVTTSLAKTPVAFAAPKDGRTAAGRYVSLTMLSEADRTQLDTGIAMARNLQGAEAKALAVETLDAATAKGREAGFKGTPMPGVAFYRNAKNDQVAAMFTVANGRYAWRKGEVIALRLNEPMTGQALYFKNGGPTDNLTVVINGVHKVTIPAIAQLGAAIVTLPQDLQILDLRLEADGTAQIRGVVLVK